MWGKMKLKLLKKILASYLHRAATTTYPCYIPVLGDSVGAGRIRLARAANLGKISAPDNRNNIYLFHFSQLAFQVVNHFYF